MTGQYGIKETKEALIASNEIAVFCAKRFKDGVQFEDFTAFYKAFTEDEEFKAKLQDGWENGKQIPAEVKDIDLQEGIELTMVQIQYVPKFIEALKKEEVKEELVTE